jgi:hypothetical protein
MTPLSWSGHPVVRAASGGSGRSALVPWFPGSDILARLSGSIAYLGVDHQAVKVAGPVRHLRSG